MTTRRRTIKNHDLFFLVVDLGECCVIILVAMRDRLQTRRLTGSPTSQISSDSVFHSGSGLPMRCRDKHSVARSRSLAYSTIDEGRLNTTARVSGSPPQERKSGHQLPALSRSVARQSY